MSKQNVDDYSDATDNIKENVIIKTEIVDIDISNATIPLRQFIPDERGNVVQYTGESQFRKPEPIEAGPSGSRIEENISIKTEIDDMDNSDAKIPLRDLIPDERWTFDEYKDKTQFIKPEPIKAGPFGSGNTGDSASNIRRVKSHVCAECDRAFCHKGSVKNHIYAVHLKIKEFECGECGRAFGRRRNLKAHLDAVHRKLKKFSCADCDLAFTQLQKLKEHVEALHWKLNKYSCRECDRTYTQEGSLKTHVNAVHKKIKYTCGVCDRTFTQRSSLKSHVDAIHKNIKKFTCEQCPRAFTRQIHLKEHVEAAHMKLKVNK